MLFGDQFLKVTILDSSRLRKLASPARIVDVEEAGGQNEIGEPVAEPAVNKTISIILFLDRGKQQTDQDTGCRHYGEEFDKREPAHVVDRALELVTLLHYCFFHLFLR